MSTWSRLRSLFQTAACVIELTAADIRWTLEPLPIRDQSDDDPLVEALIDSMGYRTVLQESLHGLAAVVHEHDRLAKRYHSLLAEWRASR